jgi:cytoskeleton protein RodZ
MGGSNQPVNENTPMGSFGENLRREREMRGVTLQEISAATKISGRFLQALEEEEFAKLPGGVFTRSFIRAYAKYLGLDEDRVLAEYQLIAQPKADVDLSRLAVSHLDARRERSRGPLLTLLLAVILVGGGYLLYRYSHPALGPAGGVTGPSAAPTPATPASPPPQATSAPAAAPSSIPPAAERSAAPAQGVGGSGALTGPSAALDSGALSVASAEGGLVLQVAATERAWVAVDADGRTVLQQVLNPGEIETLKAKESFDVTTGNAQGIVLTLNGETLKPLGRRGEVKSIRLTQNDVKKTSP